MRWKGLIFIAIVAGIVIALLLIFTDEWLENRLEETGSNLHGAKIQIDNLDFSFLGPVLSWDRLQVTDARQTMKNVIETGRCEFKMEFWPLLSKKIIIDNFQMTELRTNTDRESDGKLEREKKRVETREPNVIEKTAQNIGNEISANPNLMLSTYSRKINVDSLVNLLRIQSVSKIDSLQDTLSAQYTQWDNQLSSQRVETRLNQLESKIRSLAIDDLQTVSGFQSTLKKVDQINTSVDSLSKVIQNTKNDLLSDLRNARTGVNNIDDWIQSDYQHAISLVGIPEINTQNIGRFIFGAKIINEVQKYLGYIATAREYASLVQSDKSKEPQPPRFEGQTIHFSEKNTLPRFWIRNIELSGQTSNAININGQVKDIVSNQKLINSATTITINGNSEQGATLGIDGTLNYLGEIPNEQFDIQYNGFSLAKSNLSYSPFLPYQVQQGRGSVQTSLQFVGEQVDASIKFVGQQLQFNYGEQPAAANRFEQIIRSIVQSIDMIDFIARIQGAPEKLRFSLNSNLDNIFVAKLKSILASEVQQARERIRNQINTQVEKHRAELNQYIQQNENRLRAEVANYEEELEQTLQLAEARKKELENRIQKELDNKENQLKEELKDNLKNLLKE